MATRTVNVWFDPEGDFLEVLFDLCVPGYFRESEDDRIMEKVGEDGVVIGFSILGVSTLQGPASLQAGLSLPD